jgi:hypothetical protein
MPARVVLGMWAFVLAFFGFKRDKKSPEQIDQLILDSYNKSRESWVAKGWVAPR